ncbi:MAG: hypothetical protein J4431_03395 [Candidatus Aenigmarchaeota archaeon]|nr:hypothetical protein [Candidatus Aenigmarchaeota archaeon]
MTTHQEKEERRQRREETAEQERKKRDAKKKVKQMIVISTGLAVVAVVAFLLSNASPAVPDRPIIGDHWHADYSIEICGEMQPIIPEFPGGIHTHGDGKMHIHPYVEEETGKQANLALFFSNAGMEISNSSIQMPGGAEITQCNGVPGKTSVTLNGNTLADYPSYAMQDGDVIAVKFS